MKKYFIIISSILIIFITVALLILVLKVIPEKKEEALLKEQILQYYESKYQQYRLENDKYADYEVDVAFLGDSLTDGYDLSKYYPQFTTANRGIGGETTFGLESRMELSVYELKPKVVVMLIGGNNLNTMFDNYENLLKGLQENLPDTKVILLSLSAMGRDWAHKNQLAAYNNVKIKALAEKYGLFCNIFCFDKQIRYLNRNGKTTQFRSTEHAFQHILAALLFHFDHGYTCNFIVGKYLFQPGRNIKIRGRAA